MGALDRQVMTFGHNDSQLSSSLWPLMDYPSWYRDIPPERVGLRGEYDHHGLAKRVVRQFQEIFGKDAIARLGIQQRGRVIILTGTVASEALLKRLVLAAMAVEGTATVELRGVVLDAEAEAETSLATAFA